MNMSDVKVEKRDGSVVDYDIVKITNAFCNAFENKPSKDIQAKISGRVNNYVENYLLDGNTYLVNVERIQDFVEIALMDFMYFKEAKEYILYRDHRSQERKSDIFKTRVEFKPFEYPEMQHYWEAIQNSFWTHHEFNYTSDVTDFNVNLNDNERDLIRKCMLAISQVEVAVKSFWGDIGKYLPKPEVANVGATFSGNEVIHSMAYSHLLEILGLNNEFENIKNIPVLNQRVKMLQKVLKYDMADKEDFVKALFMFSVLIEHVSLFSQFYIMLAFNNRGKGVKGISNVVTATSKEEQIHGDFGLQLIKIIKRENPELFGKEFEQEMRTNIEEFLETENAMVDWFFEDGDTFITKYEVKQFLLHRINQSVNQVTDISDFKPISVEDFEWFDIKLNVNQDVDFFYQRSVDYTKKTKPITADDLF